MSNDAKTYCNKMKHFTLALNHSLCRTRAQHQYLFYFMRIPNASEKKKTNTDVAELDLRPRLRAVRESLIDSQVAGEHDSYVARPVKHRLCLKSPVEVAGLVKQPRILCANFGTDKTYTLFSIPILSACSSRALTFALISQNGCAISKRGG